MTTAKKRDVYVTGFDKFGNVRVNPTKHLAEKLADHPNVTEAHVLEVSADGSAEVLEEMYARAEERDRPCIFLHFGVITDANSLKLEKVAYNEADFRIPDERGYIAKNEIIHQNEPDTINTKVPLEAMLMALQELHPKIAISTDPGRFICNYVYYRSLVWVKRQENKEDGQHLALFIHMPKYQRIAKKDQILLASKIVDFVADL